MLGLDQVLRAKAVMVKPQVLVANITTVMCFRSR